MMSRDFLARMESLRIEIKPDAMKEVKEQLDLWPPDRVLAYIKDVVQLIIDQTSPHFQEATERAETGERPDLMDERISDAASLFALAMLRVYQAKDLAAALSRSHHEA